jgi:hypothetical protein
VQGDVLVSFNVGSLDITHIFSYLFFSLKQTYGLPLSYSIFQNYYSTQPEFKDSSITSLVSVGALWSGLTLMGAGLVAVLSAWFSLKTLMYTGSFIMAAGLIGASFATHVWHLILTQGKKKKAFKSLLHVLIALKALFLGLGLALVSCTLDKTAARTLLTIAC